jgi:hypothetical protein
MGNCNLEMFYDKKDFNEWKDILNFYGGIKS